MSTGLRVPLEEARIHAVALAAQLRGSCERLTIAGSIRRARPDVGDIELVAIPVIDTVPDGMFDKGKVNRLTEAVDRLIEEGILGSHPTDPKRGERYSKLMLRPVGLQVDLFSATVDTWGLILLIRTGPADYSREFVTDLHQRHLHAAGGELHKGGGLSDRSGWHPPFGCPGRCEIVPTREEEDVYAAARLPFIPAEERW